MSQNKDMQPKQILIDNMIILEVPTTHSDSGLRYSFGYRIRSEGANDVAIPKITTCNWGEKSNSVHFVPNDVIIRNMYIAMRYMEYARDHLDKNNNKNIPIDFKDWVEEQKTKVDNQKRGRRILA